ncbi:oxidoreductase [Gemmobacter aquaticus]|jgi:catechol 2,3-dioxygenase-like lactoylglutathione lyase family enzyme|uniref:Oxidoreductase n=1 Tax=Gemmobacter aquaticus TaxID=490185 RepID=A0A917YFY1_9RHOB|nr:VOC family protein [Gemmobacter aquaticus]GGO24210.1 oxidoreductase [Gemmobacter aquaticus]
MKKFDPKVFQLGYVALEAPDLEETRDHYIENLGMTELARGDDGAVYLSIGHYHHDLVLRPAEQKSLMHLGYQLKPHITVADMARAVQALGLKAAIKTDSQPGVSELVEVVGPGGNIFQFYNEIAAPTPGYKHSGVPILRLGHVAVISPEAEKLMAFYEDFLGFVKTDDIAGIANFYTCNREHHVVNIVNVPMSRVHHIAFELRGTAHHAQAADALARAGVNQLWGPARHTAGHNIAGYHYDPNQVMVELYTEMDVFIPELGIQEPRPWHEETPMRPKSWQPHELNAWGAEYGFNLAAG